MVIQSIELQNYRNYPHLVVEFHPGINIFYGDNAQGKTNILEAIYLCGTNKSHRGSKDREIIAFGQDEAHIKMYTKRNSIENRIDMHLKKGKSKGIAINGVPIHKVSELFGMVNIVFFSPEDLQIIKNGPSERRKFIDLELCQLDKLYIYDLVNYNRSLQQRNRLLKEAVDKKEFLAMLEVWEAQLVKFGKPIIHRREKFIHQLNPILTAIHRNLTGEKEELIMVYDPDTEPEQLELALCKNRDRELKQKTTMSGPHRDDIRFIINGIDIRTFGSQGQQRSAALSLKLAEIELVKQQIKDVPILLLDDVLSELDSNRQNYLLDSMQGIQTMITCTGLDDFINHRFHMDHIFHVVQGTVIKENGSSETGNDVNNCNLQ